MRRCLEWLSFHIFSGSYTSGNYYTLYSWYFCDFIYVLLLVKSVRSLKRRRLDVYSWAKGAYIKWECGCMNAVVGSRLLPLIVLGYLYFLIFYICIVQKEISTLYGHACFLNSGQHFFFFPLAGQMMFGIFQESYAHVMVSAFASGSLFWSRSWCFWIHNMNMQSLYLQYQSS